MTLKKISDINFAEKKVLIRVDINSPIVDGKVLDNPRIKDASRSIKFFSKNKAKLVIIAHQGRKGDNDFASLEQHAKLLAKYSKVKVKYIDYLFEQEAIDAINNLKSKEAIILKNVREYADEKEVDNKENKYIKFSKNFDIFVNDAFAVSHRVQASIIIPPKFIPGFIGPSLEKELSALSHFDFKDSKTVYLIGGAKIDDYLPIFNNLKNKKNKVIASGILANLLIVAKGKNLGYENAWLSEKGYFDLIPKLKDILKKYDSQIILPIDFAIEKDKKREEHAISDFPTSDKIWDVGKKSLDIFKKELKGADAVFMKGPLGYSEIKNFSFGTVEILKEISSLTKKKKVFSLLGGGHLTTSIERYKIPNNYSHISLSGGALIAYISKEKLPGLEALDK